MRHKKNFPKKAVIGITVFITFIMFTLAYFENVGYNKAISSFTLITGERG